MSTKALPRTWAMVMLLTLNLHIPGFGLVPLAGVVGLLCLPRALKHAQTGDSRSVKWYLPMALTAIALGMLLRYAASPDDGIYRGSSFSAVLIAIWFLSFAVEAIAGAYALHVLGLTKGLAALTLGAAVGGPLYVGTANSNVWKYTFSFSLGVFVLYIASRVSRIVAIATSMALFGLSIALDSRSVGAAFLIAGLTCCLPPRRPGQGRIRSGPAIAISILLAFAFLQLGSLAMRDGLLGQALQTQYLEQTYRSGNVLLGGRAELNASAYLIRQRPKGYGIGVVPGSSLQGSALARVAAAGGDPNRAYYGHNVFAARVDLHSITADMTYYSGVGGLALAALTGSLLLRALPLSRQLEGGAHKYTAVVVFLLSQALWSLAFSPMAQLDQIGSALAVAVALSLMQPSRDTTEQRASGVHQDA